MSRPTKKSGQVSYRDVAAALLEEIRSGAIEVGSLLPTERELQDRFGATRSAVRRALAEIVDTGWGDAIPNKGVAASIGLDRDRSQNIAFVDHRSTFNRNLFVSLSVRLQSRGWHLVLVDSQDLGVEGALEYANERRFAGAYVWSKKGYPDAERLRPILAEMPIIALDHSLKTVATDLITDDNYQGAWHATRHLATLGRKRIAVSGMFDMTENNQDRFGGYLQGLFDAGLAPAPRDFLFTSTSGVLEADTRLLSVRLSDSDRPDAFFVLQDEHVLPVAEAILTKGLRIPQDVALVAFREDAIPTFGDVALSTVAVDWEEYAETCVQRMLQRMERPSLPPETFRLPTSLHVRGSCGAPQSAWTDKTRDMEFSLSQAIDSHVSITG